ncbi:MAG: 23S rRNA (adenine(2503)-C(2))-methyltransferase RlmN [Patescibacteria group bacterium]
MNSFEQIISTEPKYRRDQIWRALFDPKLNNFSEITTLPKDLRAKLEKIPWLPVEPALVQASRLDDTQKALLRLADDETIETVLMGRANKRATRESDKRYTICVSSQVGCAMRCAFCATGEFGFRRNLSAEEIIGQFRFWQKYLLEKNGGGEIENIVLMGQGEPLVNYDAVKDALNLILKYTKVGETKITLSTAGVVAGMNKMIEDKDFPAVRFALSLHSAIPEDRKKLMPSQPEKFFEFFIDWCEKYHERWPSRTHFVGLEYVFINGVNDTPAHLKALIKLASKIGRVRLNLIPFNAAAGKFSGTPMEKIKEWQTRLMDSGFTVTVRLSQGSDIAAACGQLRNLQKL